MTQLITRYGKTYDEAREKLVALLTQHHQGMPASTTTLTVAEYLENWLAYTVAKSGRRPTAATPAWHECTSSW